MLSIFTHLYTNSWSKHVKTKFPVLLDVIECCSAGQQRFRLILGCWFTAHIPCFSGLKADNMGQPANRMGWLRDIHHDVGSCPKVSASYRETTHLWGLCDSSHPVAMDAPSDQTIPGLLISGLDHHYVLPCCNPHGLAAEMSPRSPSS